MAKSEKALKDLQNLFKKQTELTKQVVAAGKAYASALKADAKPAAKPAKKAPAKRARKPAAPKPKV
ncbi:hypothetical protein AGMMS49942_14660 [Spirochaetia bacterium]|nr:hypothetical protein AGMMS49942_14660 [Spirochaetia bacterium]